MLIFINERGILNVYIEMKIFYLKSLFTSLLFSLQENECVRTVKSILLCAHIYGKLISYKSKYMRGKQIKHPLCEYATFIHEAPGLKKVESTMQCVEKSTIQNSLHFADCRE